MNGGAQRSGNRRAVVILAAILALSSADGGTVGALAPQLETAFHIGTTQIGLIVTVRSLVGAAAALPLGVLVDRWKRTRILAVAIMSWSLAMVATGSAVDFATLLGARLALGLMTAAAGPAVASLVGDMFPPGRRSRVYGYVLTGELVGAGFGLVVAGDLGATTTWRAGFYALALPSLLLAAAVHRFLPEPVRGSQAWLGGSDRESAAGSDASSGDGDHPTTEAAQDGVQASQVRQRVRQRPDVSVDQRLVLREEASRLSPWAAGLYVLRIPTNWLLILSSALGYFFLAGLHTFAVLFSEEHFGLSHSTVITLLTVVGIGSVAGSLAGGRIADRLLERGFTDARLLVAGVGFVGVAVILLPGILSTLVAVSLPVFVVAAAFLACPNPALDAARLDVVPSGLWGRAESVRTFARTLLETVAPLLFGYISAVLAGYQHPASGAAGRAHRAAQGWGLELTFMIMLAPLAASGLVLLARRRRYLRDVATADASERTQSEASGTAQVVEARP
ncbi:MAG: MFS transporter [Acidimicrobiaceae bacterium]|nr:MFS transporter [Acidimicrobiaceae bacterium]